MHTTFLVDDTFQELLASNHLRCCLKYSGTAPLDIAVDFGPIADERFEMQLVTLLRVLVG